MTTVWNEAWLNKIDFEAHNDLFVKKFDFTPFNSIKNLAFSF